MLFRFITKDDYEEYTHLIDSKISKKDYDNFIDNVLIDNHKILILIINDQIIGTGTLLIEPKLTYGGCKMGHIENILIDEKYRGKGYGENLVNKLLELSKNEKCYRVDLNCTPELNRFYKKMNFKKKYICMNLYFKENFI